MDKVQVVCSPLGIWFADHQGWGRRFGKGPEAQEAAQKYAETFLSGDISKR
jgi:hypothetical protein